MKALILTVFLTAIGHPLLAAQAKNLCLAEATGNERLASFAKTLRQNEIFRFVSRRSKPMACKVESNSLLVDFKNGDQVVFDLNEVAPGTEVLLAKPLSPKRAFHAAQKAMVKVEDCNLNFSKPSETKTDAASGTIHTYWCKENSALSITADSTGKATRFRVWLVH
ncbi:MAG: hypothetical protein IPJ84_08840 [Bdellovibrionales bacterium]|nr:hypothetical protein [Bdellovibrionales bacterium]